MAWHDGEKRTEFINGVAITTQMADRFLCDDCEAGDHGRLSSLIGLCGCQCHDGPDGSL